MRPPGAPPAAVSTLLDRYDAEAIDLPRGAARIRIAVREEGAWDALVSPGGIRLERARDGEDPDAELSADAASWEQIAADVRGGMEAFSRGGLTVRRNLHLGVGLLAATSGDRRPERLQFSRVRTDRHRFSIAAAGPPDAEPLLCIHGLGATKGSFLPTIAALAPEGIRVIAVDLPGFGDSHKPLDGGYDAPWFAAALAELLDELGLDSAHLAGNSMGGRVAIELALQEPGRVESLSLLSPALAWLKPRSWTWLLRHPLPRLGLIQPTPRAAVEPIVRRLVPGGDDGWTAAGVDEFLRGYLKARGRFAFYEAARNIYMDEPHGVEGFWKRLAQLGPRSLFVWGREDQLVPISFMKHVEAALPTARHLELDCGHVPQLEAPGPTHRAIARHIAEHADG